MIFSDLGTINVVKTRGFSAYRWIRDELIRLGVAPEEIVYMQDLRNRRPSNACSAMSAPERYGFSSARRRRWAPVSMRS